MKYDIRPSKVVKHYWELTQQRGCVTVVIGNRKCKSDAVEAIQLIREQMQVK